MLLLRNILSLNKSPSINIKYYLFKNKDLFHKINYSSFSTYKMEDSFLTNLKNLGKIKF